MNETENKIPDYIEYKTYDILESFIYPVLVIFGIFGNVNTIFVMKRPIFCKLPISTLLIVLSIADSIHLLMVPFNMKKLHSLFGKDLRGLSNAGCAIFFWLWRTSKMTSSWCVVLISLERFLCVWMPLKLRQFNVKKYTDIIVIALCLILGVSNAIWASSADRVNSSGICIHNYVKTTSSMAMLYVGLSFYFLIPAILIIVFNLLIIIGLIKQMNTSANSRLERNSKKLTLMLIVVATSFIICVGPITAAHLMAYVLNFDLFFRSEPKYRVFLNISLSLECLNYAINYIIYIVCSTNFRTEAIQMYKQCCFKLEEPMRRLSESGLQFHRINGTVETENSKDSPAVLI